jgi:Mrp family chromosome partitioning ATPase
MALPRLIFVTGKGGTGKSTIAAALAVAISRRHPVTLADLDRRFSAARMLGAAIDTGTAAHDGENPEVLSLTPRAELEAFVERIVPLKAISRRMLKSRTFGYVTAALPGLEAFLMVERLRVMAGDGAADDRFAVIDAPATGGAIELLSVARGVKRLAAGGTLYRLAGEVEDFLRDPARFGVILAVTPEELAIREAIEAAETLRGDLGVACVAAILNGVTEAIFTPAEMARIRHLDGHARLAERRRACAESAADARARLVRARLNPIELPFLFSPALARAEVDMLAGAIGAAGLIDENTAA